MRVDFSDWFKRPGLVARKYTYSKMGSTRDTELEVHFDIQAGLSIFTFPSFIINNLDLTREASLRGSLRPMDNSGPEVSLTLMGRPDGESGAVMTVFGREDQARCLKAFLDGKDMHFGVDASDGEKLIRLPLPNDTVFQTVYREVFEQVQAANDPPPMPDLSERIGQRQGFKTNEFVVYPAHGVGQILAIEEQEIAGAKLELFVINFMKDKMTLRVPTAKVANVGMRKLSEPALVKLALETLRGSKQFQSSEWSSRAQEYESKINSGDIVSIAEVVRDLYRLESQPEQSYSERQLFEAALDRLSREIAIVQHMTEAEAIGEIAAYLAGETPTSKHRAGVSPSSLPEREASLPGEMIRLDRLPVGEDGLPQWNEEIADATREFGAEFLAPFMVEVSPGQCFSGYVSRANWQTPVRTYEARAVLIGRQNDEFRTTVVVSAPGVPRKQGSDPWMPYDFQYETSLPKVHVRDIVNTMRGLCEQRHTAELTAREQPEKPLERPMFLAKITGVIPKGMSLPAAPVETKKFPSRAEATEWLLGEALNNLPTPVSTVEVFSDSGESVWREWHWSHDALKAKNEKWWDQREPNRKVIEKLQAERRQKIASGEISGDQLSLAEQFQRDNPAWTGPHFASMPVKTIDSGWIWRREYWERPHTGLRYTSKSWFSDE